MTQQTTGPLAHRVTLREVREGDLALFFEQQLDAEANYMAAFTAKDPTDWEGFMAHWHKIWRDEGIVIRTILSSGQVVGHVLSHAWFGEPEVSYWIGKAWWGQGIATMALAMFLRVFTVRPLYARVVKDNIASRRVLEKCGFLVVGQDKGFANARGKEVEELILRRSEA